MKQMYKQIIFLILLLMLIVGIPTIFAQEPPHPPLSGHGIKGNQPAGNAKIEGGVSILVAFALAYGYRKIRKIQKGPNQKELQQV